MLTFPGVESPTIDSALAEFYLIKVQSHTIDGTLAEFYLIKVQSHTIDGTLAEFQLVEVQGHMTARRERSAPQAPPPQARAPTKPEGMFARFLRRSFLAFASPALEQQYQAFVASQVSGYVAVMSAIILMAWVTISSRLLAGLRAGSLVPPAGLPTAVLLNCLPTAALFVLAVRKSKLYPKHWRLVHLLFLCTQVIVLESIQELVIWMQFCRPEGQCSASDLTSLMRFRTFTTENFFFTAVWSRAVVYTSGQAVDVCFATGGLLLSLLNNERMCASRLWVHPRVSQSPLLMGVAQRGSKWLFGILSVNGMPPPFGPPGELSCPAVRAFWQILGWWQFCLLLVLREVLSRRAFLHSPSVLQKLGPSLAASAKRWPFGSPLMVQKLVCIIAFACFAAAVMWVQTLQILQG
jgi:hypothetical protein